MVREAKIFATESNLSLLLRQQEIHSVSELARRCEMPKSSINAAVNGKREQIFGAEPGTYRKPARRIAEVLKVPPELLFGVDPEADERRKQAEIAFMEGTTRIPPTPEDVLILNNLRESTTRVLSSLTPRQEQILRMRFGIGRNTDDSQFGVARERIREIEAKALRKLKHPTRSKKLRSFLDD